MNGRLVLGLLVSSVLACHAGDDETDPQQDDVCRLVQLEYTDFKAGTAYRWNYGYDDRGNRVEEAYDATTDGLVDSLTTTTSSGGTPTQRATPVTVCAVLCVPV